MSNLPANHPTIALHITDRSLTPLLSSSSQPSHPIQDSDVANQQAQALHSLTSTSIIAYETARRLGLGLPQRLMIETSNDGPVLLQSYLNPSSITSRNLDGGVENTNGYLHDLLDVGRPSTGVSEPSTETNTGGPSHPLTNGFDTDHGLEEHSGDEYTVIQPPPTLFGTVVVPSRSDLNEGRTVAMRMERVGRQFQREWLREQVLEREQAPRERSADGNDDG